MDILPYGWKYQANNPTHPNGNYSEYRKGVLRGIASGLSCSYNILANDLVGVSYSSLRGGLLDEREVYKMIQEWMKTRFHMEVFEDWLESSILAGEINLPISKFDKFNVPFFQGRSWAWVDPKKDIEASAMAIQNGFTSRRQVVSENGGYILDVAKEQKADAELEKRYGLSWGEPAAKEAAAPDEPELDLDGNPIPGTEPDAE
jgi:lambda family phage portal protein